MKFRGLLAAVAVLAILGGVLYWSGHHKPAPSAASLAKTIVNIKPADIASMTLKEKGAAPITLSQPSSGNWTITAPANYSADQNTVTEMASNLQPLKAQRVVEQDVSDLSEYGLTDPVFEIDIATQKNGVDQILFGGKTPTGDNDYVLKKGDPELYTVNDSVLTELNQSLVSLRDRRLIPVKASAVQHIALIHSHQTVTFERTSGGWQMKKPQPYRTDIFQVDDLLQQVVGAKWGTTDNSKKDAALFAHGSPFATVKLSGNFGTDSLEVRNADGHYYAKSSAISGIWKIKPALVAALDRSPNNFRNRQILNIGYANPSSIQYHSAAVSFDLTRSNHHWYSNGIKMDGSSVASFVSAIRDLSASRFVTSGFSKPGISLTVSVPGKPTETVRFQKSNGGAIARRAVGPSLYYLDSTTMNQLYSAAKGVKPAASEKNNEKKK